MVKELLVNGLLSALLSLPIYKEDQGKAAEKTAQLTDISTGIAQAVDELGIRWPGTPEELGAVTIAVGYAETGYSLRIQSDGCFTWECDHGRALGLFQMHQRAVSHPGLWKYLPGLDWGSVELSTREAVLALTKARRRCTSLERAGHDWIPMTFSSFRNGHCVGTWKGLAERVRSFHRIHRIVMSRGVHTPET